MENNKEELINSVINGIEKLATDSMNTMSGTITKYGPDVLNTAESYIRIISIIKSVEIFIPFLVFSIVLYFSVKWIFISVKSHVEYTKDDKSLSICSGVVLAMAAIMGIGICASFINIDLILGIVSPKMELIKLSKDTIVNHVVSK